MKHTDRLKRLLDFSTLKRKKSAYVYSCKNKRVEYKEKKFEKCE
jgi:hypothetical protein